MFIFVLTALARELHTSGSASMALEGRIRDAIASCRHALDTRCCHSSEVACEQAILGADLLLAQDRDEEAEELYRLATKLAGGGARGRVRVISSRNTGFLSLYQQRYSTAATCFERVAHDAAASAAQRVEALAGLALAQHGTGQALRALETLALAGSELETAPVPMQPALRTMIGLLTLELSVQNTVRSHPALGDHVFWQLGAFTAAAEATPANPAHDLLHLCSSMPLAAERLSQLRDLDSAARGDAPSCKRLQLHVATLGQRNLGPSERQARIDTALIAIAAKDVRTAQSVLEPLLRRCGKGSNQRWNFELSYCSAKICELTGRSVESLKHYQHYALESVHCLRSESQAAAVTLRETAAPGATTPKDEVEMSLPAKYRRAYRYLLSNLDRTALSVREIAEHIGVTERALQLVFKNHVGMTPAEVLRRCRVERIREALLSGDSAGLTVLEAGARWGICNRSTLVASYRRYFSETPAETLLNKGQPVAFRRPALASLTAAA